MRAPARKPSRMQRRLAWLDASFADPWFLRAWLALWGVALLVAGSAGVLHFLPVAEDAMDTVGVVLLLLLALAGAALLPLSLWGGRERLQEAASFILEDTHLVGVVLALAMAVFAWPLALLLRGVAGRRR